VLEGLKAGANETQSFVQQLQLWVGSQHSRDHQLSPFGSKIRDVAQQPFG